MEKKTKLFNMRMRPSDHEKYLDAAAYRNVPLAEVIEKALEKFAARVAKEREAER